MRFAPKAKQLMSCGRVATVHYQPTALGRGIRVYPKQLSDLRVNWSALLRCTAMLTETKKTALLSTLKEKSTKWFLTARRCRCGIGSWRWRGCGFGSWRWRGRRWGPFTVWADKPRLLTGDQLIAIDASVHAGRVAGWRVHSVVACAEVGGAR